MNLKNQNSLNKLLLIILYFCLLSILLIIISTKPAFGYEISIYNVYPRYFWLLFIVAISCGLIILVLQSFLQKTSKYWGLAFISVIFTNAIFLLIPLFRGYYTFGRGDVLAHLGFINDILVNGHFAPAGYTNENFFPIIHILSAQIYYISGLSPNITSLILPIFFISFYMFSIYLLSYTLTQNKKSSILIAAFGLPLMYLNENLMLAPSVQAFYLLPFVLFIYYKSKTSLFKNLKYSILLVLTLLVIPFLHPGEGTFAIIFAIIFIDLSLLIYKKWNEHLKKAIIGVHTELSSLTAPILIIFVIWATWFLSFSRFSGQFLIIFRWFTGEVGTPTVTQFSNAFSLANLTVLQLIQLIILTYGQDILYFSLASLVSLLILKKFLSKKQNVNLELFTFGIMFIGFLILTIVSFFNITGVDWSRFMRYLIFSAIILNGMGLYVFYNKSKHIKKISALLIIFLVLTISFTTFNALPSPIIQKPNYQVTNMEITGTYWFMNNRENNTKVDAIKGEQNAYFRSIKGTSNIYVNVLYNKHDHFNYTTLNMYGDFISQNRYFIDWEYSRVYYQNVYPNNKNLWNFTEADFYKLDNNDQSVSKIYNNGEYWVYYIKSLN